MKMSKSLRSMTKPEREAAITRRLMSNSKGLGYWGAVDAQKRKTEKAKRAAQKAAENA